MISLIRRAGELRPGTALKLFLYSLSCVRQHPWRPVNPFLDREWQRTMLLPVKVPSARRTGHMRPDLQVSSSDTQT